MASQNRRGTLVFILIVLAGTLIKFRNIELQEFYLDETATLTNATGHSLKSLDNELWLEGSLSAPDVFKYQKSQPHLRVSQSFLELARGDPLHPPLYFLLCRLWIEGFGDSVASVRSLSILFGLMLLGAVWRLLLVLFKSREIAFLGVALSAVSPFLFIVTTSAREYSLWILLITLATTEFWERRWIRYFLFSFLSLYTSLLTLPVLLAHWAYYLYENKTKLSPKRKMWIVGGCLVATILFLPWMGMILKYWPGSSKFGWLFESVSPWHYLSGVAANLYKIFFDLDIRKEGPLETILLAAPIAVMIIFLEVLAFRHLFQDKQKRSLAIFLSSLLLATIVFTIGVDLVFGGKRGLSSRYHIFGFLLIQVVVTAYLAGLLRSNTLRQRQLGWVAISILVVGGLFSQFLMSSSETWWSKHYDSNSYDIARRIDQTNDVLLVSGGGYNLITLARYLPPHVRLTLSGILEERPELKKIKKIFLFRLNDQAVKKYEEENQVVATQVTGGLWKVEPEILR